MTLNLPVRSLYRRPPLASLQCPCPVPHLAAHAQRAPVPVAQIAVRLRHHPRAAHNRLRMLQAQRQAVQPVHRGLHHPNCFRWSALSTACTRDKAITRSQILRDQQQRAVLKQVASQRTNRGPSQCLQLQICHFPRIPEDVQVTRGLRARCRQRMPMLLVRAVTQRTDYRTFKKSLIDALDHPVSRNWPNSSRLHQMKRRTAVSTTGRDERSSLSRRGRRRVKNKHCNLTLKTKDGPLRTVLCFPEMSL